MSVVADDIVRIATVDKARGYWASVFRRLARDPVSVACASIILLIVLALFFVFLNLVVDVIQAAIDPRIKRA